MKSNWMAVTGVAMIGTILLFCTCRADNSSSISTEFVAVTKPAASQAVYVCTNCQMIALQAGKCTKCGNDLVGRHMLGIKDGKVLVCECHGGCACTAEGMKDGKCVCGKPVQEVSAKGMYICACPEGKCCSMISDKPGKCTCGAQMKKVE